MTPDRTDANPDENAEHGVLDESGNLDTASITILGGHIAQVNVDLPVAGDDDDLDDDVIEDEIPFDDADLAALDVPAARHEPADDAVEVDELATDEIILEPHDEHHDGVYDDAASADDDVHDADVVGEETHGGPTSEDDLGAVAPDVVENPDAEHAGSVDTESDGEAFVDEPAFSDETAEGQIVDADGDAGDAPQGDEIPLDETGDAETFGDDASERDAAADALTATDAGDHGETVLQAGDQEPSADAHAERAHVEDERSEGDFGGDDGLDDAQPAERREDAPEAMPASSPDEVSAPDDDSQTGRAPSDDRSDAEHAVDDQAHGADAQVAPAPDEAHRAAWDDTRRTETAADAVTDDAHDLEVVDDVELWEADAAEPLDEDAAADDAAAADAEPLTHAPWVPSDAAEPAPIEAGDDDVVEAAIDDETHDDQDQDDAPGDGKASGSTTAPAHRDDGATEEAVLLTARVAEEPASAAADAAKPATPTMPASAAADAAKPATPTTPASAAAAAASTGATEPVTGSVPTTRAERAATGVIGTVPLTRRRAQQADEAARAADEAARVDRAHALERVRTPAPEVALTSKRIGQIDDARESADLLTADRLLDPKQISRPEPEGLWQQLVYSVSGHRINLGDGRRARQRKDLDRRISAPLSGGARFVPVLSRKGGVGKTTVTSLLGMALADARDDRIIAVDANPDRGTLADRVGRPNGRTVRDLVRAHDEMAGYNDVSSIVARDATRLDVLASDADPRVSEAFSDDDYRQVADVAAHYYSIVLTDTGTGIVHSVMGATLELADTLVIVAGLSVDEARLASETLTWLETNGYAARVRDAVVVLNNSRPGAPLVRESELEAHFRSRVRTVIRMPYDARIAAGSAITFRDLQPSTRQAARELAAAVVEGLRAPVAVA
ncbi:MinD-like ATPase involved in chromosome partitioning or flagellar assembly [Microbacterium sp. ru370.1]|uniref:MinD/ParA family ATP-binding protein n=1 Tax=unclassified Microbacterium TaxID=2609290 RepID=UPI000881485E|nr:MULTISPECIES: MinD/ParA family protein [unclassified Microbacterium]SDO60293.1 MinD-like ATPase involved in chromosome partitioning or flagellar assembly [Microbacterium sp. ru370.1]SIT86228.1 MinD-like ATPase involved in chromosome partitioning or flagellar assembly [Microbacterium sp. RU1D]